MAPDTPSRAPNEQITEAGAEPNDAGPGSKLEPGLYLVATPIGNLGDITLRALKTLGAADAIACEDSRVSAKLLAAHGIKRPLIAYHDHNAARMRPKIIERLKGGESVALISDAGTPLVSDPGYKLVQTAVAAGLKVTVLPGPSAPLAALLLSGLPSDRFFFGGFLPVKSGARRGVLQELAAVGATLIFFESGPRLAASLGDMAAALGDRPAAVARELTKLFEELRRDSLGALAAHYRSAGPPKGEIVVVVGPPLAEAAGEDDAALDADLRAALESQSLRDAVALVAAAHKRPKRAVYARALELMKESPGDKDRD